jgi:hypothetical protein
VEGLVPKINGGGVLMYQCLFLNVGGGSHGGGYLVSFSLFFLLFPFYP